MDRTSSTDVNKKAVEVLVKTGAFDNLGQNRATLLANMDLAVNYTEKKKESTQFGQVSLFENTGEKEFNDFVFKEMEEMPYKEKLNMEKELIGCYLTGHPLDEYRQLIKSCSNISSSHMSKASPDKQYTIVGLITSIRPFYTKSGRQMAFAKLEDLDGTIDLTFFPKTWEKLSATGKLQEDAILGIEGKPDNSRENQEASFIVENIIGIDELKEKTSWEVHIRLTNLFSQESQIYPLRDFLFGSSGNSCVYFHIETPQGSAIVKANPQMTVPSSDEFLAELESQPMVESVWKE